MSIKEELRAIGELRKATRLDPAALEALQDERLRALLRHAVERSSFYRRLYAGIDLGRCAITDLPTTRKSLIQEHFDDVVTEPGLTREGLEAHMADPSNLGKPYLGRFYPVHTSGTTGHSAVVVYDEAGLQMSYLVGMARRVSSRKAPAAARLGELLRTLVLRRKARVATIIAPGSGAAGQTTSIAPALYQAFAERRILSSAVPTATLVEQLEQFQPSVLFTYPSTLELLAAERLAGRLKLALHGPGAQIITAAEPLSDRVRAMVRKAWDLEITDRYGMTECLVVAASCDRFDGVHVMSDLCLLEVVDEHNQPVPAGTRGRRVLITNLYNRVQPVIRYEIDDITGLQAEPCACGWSFPKLLPVEGRALHAFYVDHPQGGTEFVPPFKLGFVFTLPGMRQFQVAQTERNAITFRYVPLPEAPSESELAETFSTELERAGLGRLAVHFERRERIEPGKSGKYLQFVREVSMPRPDSDA